MNQKELQCLRKEVEELLRKVTINKSFFYMVIHDLKHPTEALIMQLDALRQKFDSDIQNVRWEMEDIPEREILPNPSAEEEEEMLGIDEHETGQEITPLPLFHNHANSNVMRLPQEDLFSVLKELEK